MWKDENAKSWRWSWWIYLNTSILWCGFFFVCIHKSRMMYIDSTHRFHGIGISFILEEICFCNFGLPHLWILIEGDLSWYLDFSFCPAPLHLSLIPQLLTSWLVSPARPWIWCHFNIGLILVVQIKSYELFIWIWHLFTNPRRFSGFRPTAFMHMLYRTNHYKPSLKWTFLTCFPSLTMQGSQGNKHQLLKHLCLLTRCHFVNMLTSQTVLMSVLMGVCQSTRNSKVSQQVVQVQVSNNEVSMALMMLKDHVSYEGPYLVFSLFTILKITVVLSESK